MMRWLFRLADEARHRARLRRCPRKQALGRRGEDLAHRFLEAVGMTVVARNYRTPSSAGEVDLIAWDGDALVMIEVKCRSAEEVAAPERNVDREKMRRMARAARDYARRASVPWERVRFDVVSVVLGEPPVIRHWRDAFPVKTL
ncbi:MAG: YraN family protein [Bryobacterales bacterium]|nr:YraN family protein [Bryobacteraceae bacterium]MDW8130156.1 YraN family protein [Bryobacterales bacterium]